jgi:hypothetical protein
MNVSFEKRKKERPYVRAAPQPPRLVICALLSVRRDEVLESCALRMGDMRVVDEEPERAKAWQRQWFTSETTNYRRPLEC